ncbi:MAG: chemotaxis protein CheA [Tagaea sp.]|nr:chemotaxis protein CheA [Tagaea sp.]
MADEEQELRGIFLLECEELIGTAEASVETIRGGGESEAAIHALFRAVHSMKGGAGAFGLERLASFAHAFETFMDRLRKGTAVLDAAAVDLLFDGVDVLRALTDEARDGAPAPAARYDAALGALREAAGLEAAPPAPAAADIDPMEGLAVQAPAEPETPSRSYRIRFVPGPKLIGAGIDPLRVLDMLKGMGALAVELDASKLPALADLDPSVCAFSWTMTLDSSAPRADLDDIRDMIDDLAVFEIEDTTPAPAADAAPAPAKPAQAPSAASGEPAKPREKPAPPVPTVRVDVPKLERLGNMVGELIITQAFLARQASGLDPDAHRKLFRALDEMAQHIRDIADAATSIRAQPLKAVFSRFGALVRELEKTTGKRIRMEISGEHVEIDKTVVERLSEPLTHLIRNSIDHGIEDAQGRAAAGKDPVGHLHLSAEQRGAQVAIELTDDGKGIDRARVLKKAIERGLVAAGATLTDQEIDDLIFLPGFSTADAVTSVSGRGVGMDAVRQTIGEMGGHVGLVSRPGQGTVFSLHLPLSLAILDAMVTTVGRQHYLIPISAIVESLRPAPEAVVRMDESGAMLAWRGALLRILPLGQEFGVPDWQTDPCRCILVVVRPSGGEPLALQVDDLIGQEPVVVKSLEKNYRKVRGVSGATILGDGRPALILDLPSLSAVAVARRRAERLAAES